MTSVDASVIIPCHDATATLPLQLEALARQDGAPSFEVIVADNRSTDDLDALVRVWSGRVPGLRLVDTSRLPGAGFARNVGVSYAEGERVLFCDADDLVGRDWVAAGAAVLEQVEVACGADVTLADDQFPSVDAVWSRHLDRMPRGPVEQASEPAAYPIILGGNLAIRREIYCAVGGYDASMRLANEDNDLAIRCERAGHLVHRAPAMVIAIRERAGLRATFRRARVAGRGHQQVCRRHGLQDTSPHLRGNAWRLDVLRSAGAAAKMATRPREQRDWPAIAVRAGASIGLWEGALRPREEISMIGEGLTR